MRKTIYVKPEDESLFERATEGNLSALLATLLRKHFESEDARMKNCSVVRLPYGMKTIKFNGERIWPPSDDEERDFRQNLGDPFGDHSGNVHWKGTQAFFTSKGKILKHEYMHLDYEYAYSIHDDFATFFRDNDIDPESNGATFMLFKAGTPREIELDV